LQDVFQVRDHRKWNKKGALSTIPGEQEENRERDRLEVEVCSLSLSLKGNKLQKKERKITGVRHGYDLNSIAPLIDPDSHPPI
jgi:hypothetical protein